MEPTIQRLGRKHIKCFAAGIAHKFECSYEHFAYMAVHPKVPLVTIDLLSLQISPVEFDIDRNRNLARMCQQSLLWSMDGLRPPGSVISAVIEARFGQDLLLRSGRVLFSSTSVITVSLTDDRGKVWRVERHQDG